MEGESTRQFTFLMVAFYFLSKPCSGQSYLNYSNLVTDVLNGYNPDIIPLNDHSQTMFINTSGTLYSLVDVDVVLGKVTVVLELHAEWMDSQIHWTPSDYGNLAEIFIPKKDVWTPYFVLGTPLDFTTIGESWMPVTFLSDGRASINLGDVVNSGCSFNMKYWPFDKHKCDLSFVVYGYPMTDVRLQTSSSENFFAHAYPNDNKEWLVTDTSSFIREDRGHSEIILRIEIERRSGIFIILIIFPLYGLACLNAFVFLLPSEAGERIGFSTTITLSITVFLDIISGYLPNTSLPIPFLCIVVTLGIAMSIMSIFMVIASLHFYHKSNNTPVNHNITKIVRFCNKKYRNPKIKPQRSTKKRNNTVTVTDLEHNAEDDEINDNAGQAAEISWTDVSYTVDKISFISIMVIHSITVMFFSFYLPSESKQS